MSVEWIGETTLVPSYLGNAPSFGPGGEAPPLRTESVVAAFAYVTDLLARRPDGSLGPPTEQEIAELLKSKGTLARGVISKYEELSERTQELYDQPVRDFLRLRAIKRIVYRQSWQRDDPVVQLVPGETQIRSIQLNSGLTDQVLEEFSSNLGLKAKASAIELSKQLSAHLSRTITISAELQTTVTKQLANTREGYLRRVAIWHVLHSISLHRVAYASEPVVPSPEDRFEWKQTEHIEFADTTAVQSTYFDVHVQEPI